METYITILNVLCCTSLTVILVSLAIFVLILLCKAIIEVVEELRGE